MKKPHSPSKAKALAATVVAAAFLAGCGSQAPRGPIGSIGGNLPGGGIRPGITGGCVPISQPIGFSAQGLYVDWANIVGGTIPGKFQAPGQIGVGAATTAVGALGAAYSTQQSAPFGALQMSFQQVTTPNQMPLPYAGFPNQYTAPFPTGMSPPLWNQTQPGYVPTSWGPNYSNAQGVLQLSQAAQSDIWLKVQQGMIPLPQIANNLQGICVSGMAMNIGKWDTYRLLYGGQVYLALNGSNSGYIVDF